MKRKEWSTVCFHGYKTPQERNWVLQDIRSDKAPFIVAIDVAARELGTRNQENILIAARLSTCEHMFQSINFEYINLFDEESWTELAEWTGLRRSKSPNECFHHFCDLYHKFKVINDH
ncbi:probable ATP-dependent RNA helicase ddx3 [Cotesia glomerata]|uniref:probable ATP-dependent RNA helicase ddx3 n=1 Tax=Cotesia glomerata TaxID=32391 RepID=UPI001D00A2E2|nr:probable ATP-dependent RNA helicase ddx3 [Cotesia glomerata]